nr:26S protease regulatory SU 7 [Cryptomonas paramecium]
MKNFHKIFIKLYQCAIEIFIFINKKKQSNTRKFFLEMNDILNFSSKKKWNFAYDKVLIEEDRSMYVAHCTQAIRLQSNIIGYIVDIKHSGKFLVSCTEKISPIDIEEGKRVCLDKNKYQIQFVLPSKIDPRVLSMALEEKPDILYSDIGGCEEQIINIREIVEYPLLYPKRFSLLGIDPPKGILMFGPPGTGKTLVARAVANRTNACFMRVICSELVQKYIGEGSRLVRELFQLSKRKNACIIFFDELDAIGGTRFQDGFGGDNEIQRTMLEIVNQLDGFEYRGNVKVLMATNRPDTIDPALMRPGRLDRKIEFSLPTFEGRVKILKIHSKNMKYNADIRFELLARICPNTTGADIRSICTEAGMFAIRKKRSYVEEEDFFLAIDKVVKGYSRFNASLKYSNYN